MKFSDSGLGYDDIIFILGNYLQEYDATVDEIDDVESYMELKLNELIEDIQEYASRRILR
jgi:hypothetical protein